MSALSGLSLGSSLPAIDPALVPAAVRTGGPAAEKAYQEGLGFEDVLVNELAQEMSSSAGGDGLGGSATDGTDSGLGGSSLGAYSSLLPQTLATSIMSAGGTGLALQIAQAVDPALAGPATGGRS